jgi:hypothetical protein
MSYARWRLLAVEAGLLVTGCCKDYELKLAYRLSMINAENEQLAADGISVSLVEYFEALGRLAFLADADRLELLAVALDDNRHAHDLALACEPDSAATAGAPPQAQAQALDDSDAHIAAQPPLALAIGSKNREALGRGKRKQRESPGKEAGQAVETGDATGVAPPATGHSPSGPEPGSAQAPTPRQLQELAQPQPKRAGYNDEDGEDEEGTNHITANDAPFLRKVTLLLRVLVYHPGVYNRTSHRSSLGPQDDDKAHQDCAKAHTVLLQQRHDVAVAQSR